MKRSRNCCCSILPPHILNHLASNPATRDRALQNLEITNVMRGFRQAFIAPLLGAAGTKHRTIYDAQNSQDLPGTEVLDEGGPPGTDLAVQEAYKFTGDTYDFYAQVFNRNSVDDHGLTLKSTVHFDVGYDNAFWNGRQMIYGDGDGKYFQRFTMCLDVIGHELTHGVTQNEAQLIYQGETGALNESVSDVFGSLIKQWVLKQTADQADWLIGSGLFTSIVQGQALRSMSNPGTAYNDPVLGPDPQPADMAHYVNTPDDNGGVHINSGIPNRAFFLTAKAIGGFAWQKAGLIWYRTLVGNLKPTATFLDMANATNIVSGYIFGEGSTEQTAVRDAWTSVGIPPTNNQFMALTAPPQR